MILFDLRCRAGHLFEAWFRDGTTFEAQQAGGEIGCPICGETRVNKAPMAPHIAKDRSESQPLDRPPLDRPDDNFTGDLVKELERLCRTIEEGADYVGDRFPEEARRIHSGESEPRDIFGEASDAETRALLEEGVKVIRIPWGRRRHS